MTSRATRVATLAAAGGLLLTLAAPPQAEGCGGTPPPPRCAYNVTFAKAAPGTLPLTGGGTFILPTAVFLALPPGIPPCPVGPYSATITINLNCAVPGNGFGTVTVPVTPGFNIINVPVTVAPGPPRLCNVVGTASVAFINGVTVSQTADQVICIVDPAPGMPGTPRLDLQHLSPEIQAQHPGDQSLYEYTITNNDPTETWTGIIEARMNNVAGLPAATGPVAMPNQGPYALADPGPGDDYPIAFPSGLDPLGCVPLPPDPQNSTDTTIAQALTLLPGETQVVEIYARSWGMCADGSCGEMTVVADGLYTDGTNALACTGSALLLDASQPPQFAWPDSGAVAQLCPPDPFNPFLPVFATPDPFGAYEFAFIGEQAQLFAPPLPTGLPPFQYEAQCLGRVDEYGRIIQHFREPTGGPLFPVDSFFDVAYQIEMPPLAPADIQLPLIQPIPGAPFGFDNVAPVAMGTAEVDENGDFTVDSFFDITYQISGIAHDTAGQSWPVEFLGLNLNAFGPGFQGQAQMRILAPPGGPDIERVEILHDFRGFARPGGSTGPCSPADITTTGACTPGAFDGVVDLSDFACYLNLWAANNPIADITPTGACSPVNPDGTVDLSDFSCYLSLWSLGCP
ncbi:MAG: GC-type dockerin domain-anchored protein [Planctomycetota bacterium]